MENVSTAKKHTHFEDIQALIIGTLLISLGVNLYSSVGLLAGGTAGLAFLAQYSTSLSFGQAFFLVNLPFYWLALKQMGAEFTIKTFISVLLLSAFSELTPLFIQFELLNVLYASIIGGLLMGAGFLMLFRHNASLGGLNILARYLAQTRGISIGKFQMAVDCVVVLMAIFIVNWQLIVFSIMGAIALNLIIAVNHKPGRYTVV
ncbi:YitT family protein [Psychromonas hadalis]|uniref:YitT family protein n=1 Tax=Psychromonas hadalis TaxID=211669 RepID=UPI0003B477AA|nr:YitT family protein [Psychromonas hadalis]